MELFENYRDGAGDAYDEMFDGDELRGPYRGLAQSFQEVSAPEVQARAEALTTSYLEQGVTFDIGGEERAFPLDIMPRVIEQDAWSVIDQGVQQRVKVARDVPRRRLRHRPGLRRRRRAARPWSRPRRTSTASRPGSRRPTGSASTSSGIDLIRDASGSFRVLEDNVRVPSGVSYVMTNRRAISAALSEAFAGHRIRPVGAYPRRLLNALRASAPAGVDDPTVVVLTPGRLQRRLLRARAARPHDGHRAGRGPRPGLPARPGDDADHAAASSRCT